MRVIAGTQKGRRLLSANGLDVRPTSGRVKEALFSIIGSRIEGARFLDLFAGTGAIAIEALSRGAARVICIDSNPAALRYLRENLTRCNLLSKVEIQACRSEEFLGGTSACPFDIVFADPPYDEAGSRELLPSLSRSVMIDDDTIVILEHPTRRSIPSQIGRLMRSRQYCYGDTSLTKFQVLSEEIIPG
jgi:16S rRNA (guanine966-N2)-methyltransferase